jgi:hypothetical protein
MADKLPETGKQVSTIGLTWKIIFLVLNAGIRGAERRTMFILFIVIALISSCDYRILESARRIGS